MTDSFGRRIIRPLFVATLTVWAGFAMLSRFPPKAGAEPEHAQFLGYVLPRIAIQDYIVNCCEPLDERFEDDWLRVQDMAMFSVIGYVRNHAKPTDRYLVFRYPDFAYYARAPLVRELDPILEPYYQQNTIKGAFEELRRLGITHIYMPAHEVLTLTFSKTYDIVSEPNLATLLAESRTGLRLFELAPVYRDEIATVMPALESHRGQAIAYPYAGWSKVIKSRTSHVEPSDGGVIKNGTSDEVAVCFGTINCNGSYRHPADFESRAFFEHDKLYRLRATISGYGKIRTTMLVTQPSPQRTQRMYVPLWTTTPSDEPRSIGMVFRMPQDTRGLGVIFTLDGSGTLNVSDVSIEALPEPAKS